MEKRLTSAQIDAFHSKLQHGIFYISNKGVRSTMIIKEAYDGTNLIRKYPRLLFKDKFIALTVGNDIDSCISAPT
ncbi:hypothetical protein MTR67_049722 [Solanum verrucosum]|uniref:PORR domain-containing protein n=1 Tax=Solanum verrucosum TaxID=315347 RepID=A0AAF0V1F8_SOLVR|nr:hypothetical protein MTR67_049722 [Solanum verrucosum]